MHLSGTVLLDRISKYCGEYSEWKQLQPKTISEKRDALMRLFNFLDGREFDKTGVLGYLDMLHNTGYKKPWSNTSINHDLKRIKAFAHWLMRNGENVNWIDSEDLESLPNDTKLRRFVNESTVLKVIELGCTPGPGDNRLNRERKAAGRRMLRAVLYTGYRPVELLRIKSSDVFLDDVRGPVWIVNKAKVKRKTGGIVEELLPIPNKIVDELKEIIKQPKPYTSNEKHLNTCLKRGSVLAGLTHKIELYDLRGINISTQVNNGADIVMVARNHGNSVGTIEGKYLQHNISKLREAQDLYNDDVDAEESLVIEQVRKRIEGIRHLKDKRFKFDLSVGPDEIKFRFWKS